MYKMTPKQLRNLTHILLLSLKGQTTSGMAARLHFQTTCGIDIDHHEYAYTLDWMQCIGDAEYHSHNGGDTRYFIKV